MTRPSGQLAPVWLVRVVATVLCAIGAALVYIAGENYQTMNIWIAVAMALSGVTTMSFAVIAFKTGRAEWILLDIIIPR